METTWAGGTQWLTLRDIGERSKKIISHSSENVCILIITT